MGQKQVAPFLAAAVPGETPAGWYTVPDGRVMWWGTTEWGPVASKKDGVIAAVADSQAPATDPVLYAKGYNGQIWFDGRLISIRRDGYKGRVTVGKGEKRILVRHVTGVQMKPSGLLVKGFIQFTVPGGNERRSQFGGQTRSAIRDENSVVFRARQQAAFIRIRDAVEAALLNEGGSGQPQIIAPDHLDQLKKLADLHAAGVVSDQEFAAKKAELLSRL